jgi:Ran GTPase-activating protein (RanGAP) involved in mRNA processing and transport
VTCRLRCGATQRLELAGGSVVAASSWHARAGPDAVSAPKPPRVPIAESLAMLPALHTLALSDWYLCTDEAKALAPALPCMPALRSLEVIRSAPRILGIGSKASQEQARTAARPAVTALCAGIRRCTQLTCLGLGYTASAARSSDLRNALTALTALQRLGLNDLGDLDAPGPDLDAPGPDVAVQLALGSLTQLRYLDIADGSAAALSPDAVVAALSSMRHLRSIRFGGYVTRAVERLQVALAAAKLSGIEQLEVLRVDTRDKLGSEYLAQALSEMPALRRLALQQCILHYGDGFKAMCVALKLSTNLCALDLTQSCVGRQQQRGKHRSARC